MIIVLERITEEPVYEQIARQIREHVVSGELPPGTPLPTVRALASDLGVNLNTVARAYWLLEDEGFVQIRERRGAVILAPASRPVADQKELQQELRRMLARMHQAGIPSEELKRFVEREISSFANCSDR